MSQSAPWSYQPPNTDPGGVKLFNPAQFAEQTNGPNQFNPAQQDTSTGQQPGVFNGQPENYSMGHDPAWNWNYSQQDPSQVAQDPNMYGHDGQVYDPNHAQSLGQNINYNQFYYDHNQEQWVPLYGQYDPAHGYDPNQGHFQGNMQEGQQYNGSNIEAPSGNFPQNFNQYGGNYTDLGSSENMVTNNHPFSDGQHHEQITDQSVDSEKLDQSSASQGMSGFFQNDDYDTESNTRTYDSSAQESSLQNSLNQMQEEKHADNVIKQEISGESLQTLNYSTGSLDTAANPVSAPSVQQITDQLQQVSMSPQGQIEDSKESETNTHSDLVGNDLNQSAIHGQVNSTGNVSENVSGGSPHSDDQQGLSDWEVVHPESSQMLEVPGGEAKHSREGSLDNNVQFFIGSGKNSDDGSARHTPESAQQGHNNTNLEKEKENTIDNLQVKTEHLQPQLTSSPNVSPGQKETEGGIINKAPPPVGPPPSGVLSEGSNPFRKDKANTSKNTDANTLSISQPFSRSNNPQMPSPIVASSEDSMRVAQKTQPQSPIMPRKESPFQPPNRRRTLSSQSSESEDQPKSEKEGKANSPSIPSQVSSSRESLTSTSSKQGQESEKFKRPPRDVTKSRPPVGSTRGVMSPRRIESAFQQVQKQRAKHNMSPATTLWANNDTLPVANILLAPAAPAITPILTPTSSTTSSAKTSPSKSAKDSRDVLSPVQMLINSMSEKQSDKPSEDSKQGSKQRDIRQERSHQRGSPRDRHERGSSIDRELEITRRMEEKERRRESESYRDRDRDNYKSDRARGKDRDYDPYYDRQPPPRRRDPYYGDERYDRPRSRHSLLDDDGSSSKTGQESDRPRSRHDYNRDVDRPRSRQDYGRDPYYRDKYGRVIEELPEYHEGYEQYDYYSRQGYYDRHGYYDKYYKYDQRYYDDYYGRGNYEDSFNRLLQFDYPNHGQWHHGYPSQYYNQYGQPYEDTERFTSQRGSRVHTPGSLSDTGEHQDYDGYRQFHGSRSSSRQGYDDYTRAQWDAYYASYNRGYGYGYDYDQSYVQETAPSRMTPVKHSIPHMCIRFGPGGHLVKVMPNRPSEGQPATVEIHDLNEMLQENLETEELKNFPGPLVRGDTHKNDVLTYCQAKAKTSAENVQLTDRDSAELIWRLLELLIKQNGTFVGTDIADLLLDGHEPTTVDYSMMGLKINPSSDTLDEDFDDTVDMSVVTSDRSVISRGRKTREEATDRFRHLLLYGRKKDALEWAMKNNLWGHALFLASKMDSRAHANVMTRFANSAMKMNDPLQTLFQLMSCRQPAAVTCVVDEKWGDWRPHLAMILSNPTGRDIDRKSIMTLGDTLASKGFLHASHFCYIMAQVNFGSYQKKTAKMVLVGSNHSLPLSEFSTNEAIQCTEIYEYANSLGNPSYYTVNFQSFKFLYACRLAENGFAQEALQYCEAISRVILHSPTLFQPVLVKLVYELGDRLKYFDPQKLHSTEDEDPYWLQQLAKINAGFQDGSIQPLSGSVTPYGGSYGMRAASTESGEVAGYTAGGESTMMPPPQVPYGQESYQAQQSYPTPDPNITQQQTEYSQHQAPNTYNQYGQPQENQQQPAAGYGTQQGSDYQNQQEYSQNTEAYTQGVDPNAYQNAGVDSNSQWQHQHQFPQNGYQQYDPNQHLVNQQTNQQTNTGNENTQNYYDPNSQGQHTESQFSHHPAAAQHHRNSLISTNTVTTDDDEDDEEEEEDESLAGSHNIPSGSSFDYFSAVGASSQQIVAPKMRPRTISETSTGSGGPHTASTTKKPETIPEKKTDFKLTDDKKSKEGWSWWPFKGKKDKNPDVNEMKLPDDKKPSIVWDDVKKKWINTDEGEQNNEPPPPPPKDLSMGSSMQPASNQAPPGGAPPMGNKFSLRKGKGSVPKYVDVMNSSKSSGSANVPTSLFNVMPSSQSSPAIFSPGGESDSLSTQETTSTGPSVNPSASHAEKLQAGEGPSENNQPPSGMPVMFNPAQFQGGQGEGFQSGPTSTRSSGRLKPGQRRMYPK